MTSTVTAEQVRELTRLLVTSVRRVDPRIDLIAVREEMIRWLTAEHPYALPRVNTADAVLPPHLDGHRSPDGVPAARRVHQHPRER